MATKISFQIALFDTEDLIERIKGVGRVVLKQVDRGGVGGSKSFEFPFGPKNITYEGSALEYREVQRPGRVPLLEATNPKNRKVRMNAVLADRPSGGTASIADQIEALEALASEDRDLTFTHGGEQLGFHVRIVQLSINSKMRDLSGAITRATAAISLQEVNKVNATVSNIKAISSDAITPNTTASTGDGNEELEGGSANEAARKAQEQATMAGLESEPEWLQQIAEYSSSFYTGAYTNVGSKDSEWNTQMSQIPTIPSLPARISPGNNAAGSGGFNNYDSFNMDYEEDE